MKEYLVPALTVTALTTKELLTVSNGDNVVPAPPGFWT